MSFTTRCPACGTTFKIVPDQLKISDGWVRCGHCADVFDATLFLEGDAPLSVPASASSQDGGWETETPPPAPAAPRKVVIAAPPPLASDEHDGDWLLRPRASRTQPDSSPSPVDPFTEELKQFAAQTKEDARPPGSEDIVVAALLPQEDAGEPVEPVPEPGSTPASEPEPEPMDVRRPGPADTDDLPVLNEPSFVRQARRKAFWHSRGMRLSLVLMSLLLMAALLLQWAVQERDQLAARYPSTAPLLAALCQPVGCTIGPARQIESVAIDSSNLVRRLGNFYSFDLVLKNSAALPVAVPALELSLTDTRDNVIARRVFLPAELPGAPEVVPAQGAVSMSLRLSIADSGVASMTGYRALVFYP